jgi:hypothetical protein
VSKSIPGTVALLAAALASSLCLGLASPVWCEEGMWLPQEISNHTLEQMKQQGLRLDREGIWKADGTGVAGAIVRLGATGAFVSQDGLILTNHHVAFGSVQRMSTAESNYIDRGFLARTRAEEVPALGYTAYVMQAAEDVTNQVLSAIIPTMSPLERHDAIEARTKQIVNQREEQATQAGCDLECEVSAFSGGTRYILYTFLKLPDVRVVYVPARAIGEYGGDTDNWMWPRHAGDFSFLRAYVGPDGKPADFAEANVPYRPKRFLRIARQGLADGDFTMILGFPRSTHRYLSSYSLADYEGFEYPERIRLNKQMAAILEGQSQADPATAVAVAGHLKNINNYLKKYQGVLASFEKTRLVGARRVREGQMLADLESDPEAASRMSAALADFSSLYAEKARYALKDLVLEYASDEGLLGQAITLHKWSLEKAKPDLERDPKFMNREIPDLRRRLAVFQAGFDVSADRAILRMLLREMASLPEGQRIHAFDQAVGAAADDGGRAIITDAAIDELLARLYANTRLGDADQRLRMFDLSHQDLLGQNDAFIDFAAALHAENEERSTRDKIFSATLDMLTSRWIEILARNAGRAMYPDANSTLRLNYGVVRGYSPADAVWYKPFSTLTGVVDKDRGVAPFNCPPQILEMASARRYGPYEDKAIGDVPVDFLTTHDSTNGNSGSPVLNARGELVGCLFDGNYEALACDFAFDEDLQRSINVDIRYILWVADYVDDARNILQELGLD